MQSLETLLPGRCFRDSFPSAPLGKQISMVSFGDFGNGYIVITCLTVVALSLKGNLERLTKSMRAFDSGRRLAGVA